MEEGLLSAAAAREVEPLPLLKVYCFALLLLLVVAILSYIGLIALLFALLLPSPDAEVVSVPKICLARRLRRWWK